MAQQERGARGLFQYSQVRPRHEQWPRPTPGPWPQALQRDRCLPSPRASIREVVAMTREDTGSSCCPYTLQCLSVCLSDFFTFARAFWAWMSGHAFVLPAMLDSRPQSVHSDTRQSGQSSTLLSQAEGNKGPVDMTEPQGMDGWL